MTDTLYKTADCGCEVEVQASYNWMDGYIEIERVWIVRACEYHRPKDSMENDELAAEKAEHPAEEAE